MTVRLLVPYGKYPKNTNLTTGSATEAELLRTGQADTNTSAGTTYTDPVPTERSGPTAVETTDGTDVLRADGRELLDLTAAQALVSGAGNREYLSKAPFGRVKNEANGADTTFHMQFTLECPTDVMRIGVINGTGADWADVKVALGWLSQTGSAGGTTVNAGIGRNATIAGAASGTIVGVGGTTDAPKITWTDWMQAPSVDRADTPGALPVHCLRVELPAAVANRTVYDPGAGSTTAQATENLTSAPYGRVIRMRRAAGLFASTSTAASWSGTTNISEGIAVVIQYVPRLVRGTTLMVCGNSIGEGANATVNNFGWAHELQAAISSQSKPFEVCQMSISGAGSLALAQRFSAVIGEVRPTFAHFPLFNTNDTPGTTAGIEDAEVSTMRMNWGKARAAAAALGIPLFTETGIPTDYSVRAYGATDSKRRDLNAAAIAFDRTRVLDFDAAMQGVQRPDGQVEMPADANADGIHPNTVGYRDRMMPVARTALLSLIG